LKFASPKIIKMAVEHLTKETFKEKIFDFENSKEWSFKGENPAIIDFYADWCAPCKAVAPIIEELATDYNGEVDIYKIDTEAEAELSGMFGIRSIPSILFIPKGEQPQMAAGALPKASFQQAIKDIFKIEKNN
jgi:thioredoxin